MIRSSAALGAEGGGGSDAAATWRSVSLKPLYNTAFGIGTSAFALDHV